MKKRKVIIDCDPGIDDALAIIVASQITDFEIVGITTVTGNIDSTKTFKNARNLVSLLDKDYQVYKGCLKPLLRPAVYATSIHGNQGLGKQELAECSIKETTMTAVEFICEKAIELDGELEIIAIGPLTNIAVAITTCPMIVTKIKQLTIMGGSTNYGNVTRVAEFNIYHDPHAAKIVFDSAINKHICPLDVTHKAFVKREEIEKIMSTNYLTKISQEFMLESTKWSTTYGVNHALIHDVCAIVYAYKPELFITEKCWIGIETQSELSMGKTVCDVYSDKQLENNSTIVLDVDREKFVNLVIDLINRCRAK